MIEIPAPAGENSNAFAVEPTRSGGRSLSEVGFGGRNLSEVPAGDSEFAGGAPNVARPAPATTGSTLAGGEQNARTAPAGGTGTLAGNGSPTGEQRNAAAPAARGTIATTGAPAPGMEQRAATASSTGDTGPAAPSGEQNAAASPSAGATGSNAPGTEQNAGAGPTAGATTPAGSATAGSASEPGVEEVRAFVGKDVLGPNGNVLGTLEDIVTSSNGEPEQVVLSQGGFLGLFQSQHKVDWAAAKPRIENGKLVLALTPQELTQTAKQ